MKPFAIVAFFLTLVELLICNTSATEEAKRSGHKNKTVIYTHALFRHGIRAPDFLYPTDPLTNVSLFWPNGIAQLTDIGKEQMYRLGIYIRKRYPTLIEDKYHVRDFVVTSTDVDRTIQSGLFVLAGMYPNEDSQQGNFTYEDLNSQKVPIHTIPAGVNRLMLHTSFLKDPNVCPRYFQLFNNLSTNAELNTTYNNNKAFIDNFFNKTGLESQNLPSVWWWNIGGAALTIYYERFYNLSIPNWAEDIFAAENNTIFINGLLRFLTITDEMKRLAGGPILKEILTNMKNKRAGIETKSFSLYSVHGANLINILNTLGLFNPPTFPYPDSSILFFELHEIDDEFFVKLFYRNGITNVLTQLNLPNCTDPCTLNEFETSIQDFLPVNLNTECQL